jgi:flagellar basal-body rod modification protein FlgD
MSDIAPTQSQIPISVVSDARTAGPAAPEAKNELDKDAFLQLLVAQLRYQNPLSPSDPNQFMAQTAQFTMVESLQALAADTAAQRAIAESMTATGLLGKEVSWVDTAGEEHSGIVTSTGFGAGGTTVEIDGDHVPLERITGARVPGSAPASTADTSGDSSGTTRTTGTTATSGTNRTATEPTDEIDATDGIATTDQTQEA